MIYSKKCNKCNLDMTYIPNKSIEKLNWVAMKCENCGVSYLIKKNKLEVQA